MADIYIDFKLNVRDGHVEMPDSLPTDAFLVPADVIGYFPTAVRTRLTGSRLLNAEMVKLPPFLHTSKPALDYYELMRDPIV